MGRYVGPWESPRLACGWLAILDGRGHRADYMCTRLLLAPAGKGWAGGINDECRQACSHSLTRCLSLSRVVSLSHSHSLALSLSLSLSHTLALTLSVSRLSFTLTHTYIHTYTHTRCLSAHTLVVSLSLPLSLTSRALVVSLSLALSHSCLALSPSRLALTGAYVNPLSHASLSASHG